MTCVDTAAVVCAHATGHMTPGMGALTMLILLAPTFVVGFALQRGLSSVSPATEGEALARYVAPIGYAPMVDEDTATCEGERLCSVCMIESASPSIDVCSLCYVSGRHLGAPIGDASELALSARLDRAAWAYVGLALAYGDDAFPWCEPIGLPTHGPAVAPATVDRYLCAVARKAQSASTDEILCAFGLTDVPAGIDASTDPSEDEIQRVREILQGHPSTIGR